MAVIGNTMLIGVYEIDFQTERIIQANQTLCDMLGYTEDELKTTPIADFVTPDSLQLFHQRMALAKLGKRIDSKTHYTAVTRSGQLIEVEIESFYKIEDGQIVGALVAVRGIEPNDYS